MDLLNMMMPYTLAHEMDPWMQMQPFTSTAMQPFTAQRKRMRSTGMYLECCCFTNKDGCFIVRCDAPGCEHKDLDITIDDDQLVIKIERAECGGKEETDTCHLCERKFGQFQRALRLPRNVDGENAEMKLCNGVLEICFPKKAGTAIKKKLAIKQ